MLDDVLHRVRERLEAVDLSAAAASQKAGLSRDAIRNMERAIASKGRSGVSTKTITALAPVLGVSAGWLLEGHDEPLPNIVHHVPLLTWVSAGMLKNQDGITPADIDRYVPVADLPRGDWIALTVHGDSMNRIAPDGSVIIVNRADDRLISDRFYVFSLNEGDATFKRFRRDPTPMLQPYSNNLDHLSIAVSAEEFYVVGRVRRVITDV